MVVDGRSSPRSGTLARFALAGALVAMLGAGEAPSDAEEGGATTAPSRGRESLRIEILCRFPVRTLLADPERIPRLWARLEGALLRLFPADDGFTASELPPLLFEDALAEERVVVSHLGLLPRGEVPADARLADGMLVPAFRRLADRFGEPRLRAAPAQRTRLRERLGVGVGDEAALRAADPAAEALFRHGGNDLLPETWEGAVYRPATRTLLVASAELARGRGADPRGVVAGAVLAEPPSGEAAGEWEEFTATLDLVVLEHPRCRFDLWLWGVDEAGQLETVRISWGPGLDRGWVEREAEPAALYHPHLRERVRLEGAEPGAPGAARAEEGEGE